MFTRQIIRKHVDGNNEFQGEKIQWVNANTVP